MTATTRQCASGIMFKIFLRLKVSHRLLTHHRMTNNNGYFGDRPCTEQFKTVCTFDCNVKEVTEKTCPGRSETFNEFYNLHGSLYRWQSELANYDVARASCQQLGGTLAVFRTVLEFMGVLQFSGNF